MCGIVGYAGRRNALPILLDGLKRLEYRGYDSAGVAIVGSGLQVVKDKGFIANLEAQLPPLIGSTGFAHTRWATHGAPSKVNAHPHTDCTGKLALAHNGIIENYAALREKLESRGHKFVSQTDTESLVHLIESYYEGNLEEATRKALHDARGSYAILAIHADEPGKVVGARNESPLVVGVGPDENFLASDVPALLRYTDRVLYVMDREMVVITPNDVSIQDLEGKPIHRVPRGRGEGRLRPFHAQGDPRGAEGDPRDVARAPCEPRGRRLPVAGRDQRQARRLRHVLPRGPRRQVRLRRDRAHPGLGGAGVGISVQPGSLGTPARDPDLAERRDRGHRGRGPGGPTPRFQDPVHLERRRLEPHAGDGPDDLHAGGDRDRLVRL